MYIIAFVDDNLLKDDVALNSRDANLKSKESRIRAIGVYRWKKALMPKLGGDLRETKRAGGQE